ncbi:hypothetical protein GN244_ATG01922 [Phytophthora infestans]|uniref:Uncharacterized protein n=1 Tax=Phytophthora infestans TaxID=4787 RepID=A0A833T3F7_PHYIN|nr:hypothetical protein GN244_ATG01922 [Phytophthora infestans]KAF4139917.1 hypothetical protein GN958_ATG10906 [Phytophthora infestans]
MRLVQSSSNISILTLQFTTNDSLRLSVCPLSVVRGGERDHPGQDGQRGAGSVRERDQRGGAARGGVGRGRAHDYTAKSAATSIGDSDAGQKIHEAPAAQGECCAK